MDDIFFYRAKENSAYISREGAAFLLKLDGDAHLVFQDFSKIGWSFGHAEVSNHILD